MLAISLLCLSFVLALELAWRLPLIAAFRQLAGTSVRARRILSYRRCLETRKERGLRELSRRMLHQSMRGAELLALVVAPVAALLIADAVLELHVLPALLDWQMRLILLVLSVGYAFLRLRIERRLRPC